MDEEAIRIQLWKIVSQLESGLTELSKITSNLRALIRTIDVVLLKLELQDGRHNVKADDKCFYRWLTHDVNENIHSALNENRWEAYASQDWFAGFKQFPRLKPTIHALPGSSASKTGTTFYLQVSEVLLQIEEILHSLERNALAGDCFHEIAAKQYLECSVKTNVSSVLPLTLPALELPGKKILFEENADEIFDEDMPYYNLNADILGDYENQVDDALDNIKGNSSDEDSIFLDSDKMCSSASLPSTSERTCAFQHCELENFFD